MWKLKILMQERLVKRSTLVILAFVALYLSTVSAVLAGNAYSLRAQAIIWDIPGQGPTLACKLAGIENIAKNTGVATSHVTPSNCGTAKSLPTGYLGVRITGYKDGVSCGSTAWIYSNVNTNYWQIWSNICPNPAGQQEFHTVATIRLWSGSSYITSTIITSPSQTF